MKREVFRRPRAEDDLIEIWSYVAGDNEAAADRLLEKIDGVLTMLADHPHAGRARPELKADMRSFPSGHYVVFYCPVPRGIDVVRVLSGYLDVQSEDVH